MLVYGRFAPPAPMVNTHHPMNIPYGRPVFIPRNEHFQPQYLPATQPPLVFAIPTSYMQPLPVPPPSANQYLPSQIELRKIETKPEPRQSRAIPIIDPNSKKDVTKELPPKVVSTLRNSASEFVPASHSGECKNNDGLDPLTSEDDKNSNRHEVKLDDLILEEPLPQVQNDDPSITASIRQIPSHLEQQLNHNADHIFNSKPPFGSHTSIPDVHREEYYHNDRKIHTMPFSTSPMRHQNYHRPSGGGHKKFEHHNNGKYDNRYNNNNNNKQKYHQKNFYGQQHSFAHNTTNNNNNSKIYRFTDNGDQNNWKAQNNKQSSSQKVDQECTAHPNKDLNEIASDEAVADKTMDLKDIEIDMNNNDVKFEASSVTTEDSLNTQSTVENSENSLNLSCRYSTKELQKMKKSPLVLAEPPPVRNKLLDSSLKSCVWSILFEKSDGEEQHNATMPTRMSNGNNKKSGNSRYDNQQQGPQFMRSRSGSEKHLIKVSLSIKDNVKLNEAENAWKPTHLKSPTDKTDDELELGVLIKNFRSLLNKLTVENFEHLIEDIKDKRKYKIDNQEKLSAVIELLFEKSISEPGYASTYAKLCKALSDVYISMGENDTSNRNPWKHFLITRCQQEFERCQSDDELFRDLQERMKSTTDPEEIENLEDIYFKIRQRANGTIKFIGELYKMNMILLKTMNRCVEHLLASVTEENIERLCKLLTTIGEKLENEMRDEKKCPSPVMNKYMQNLEKLKNSTVIRTLRIKFDIMNVLDLRKSNWKPRENARSTETKPQKLQELQKEEEKKQKMQQMQLNEYNERQQNSNNNNNSRNMSQGGRHNRNNNNSHHHNLKRCESDGFRPSAPKHFDMKNFHIPKTNDTGSVTLGPPKNLFQNFNKSMSQMVPPPTTTRNAFSNLPTDCDDAEELPIKLHSRSGSFSNKNNSNRKDLNNNCWKSQIDTSSIIKSGTSYAQAASKEVTKPKSRSPSPASSLPSTVSDGYEDDYFMIDLTDREEKDMNLLKEKMQQVFKGKITFEMLMEDLKKISITKNILGSVFTDLFDKKSGERKELVEILSDIMKTRMIESIVNVEALKLSIKCIPSIICDVPHAYDYFADYCVHLIQCNLLTISDVENICQNQQIVIEKVKQNGGIVSQPAETIKEISVEQESIELAQTMADDVTSKVIAESQKVPAKPKTERCLKSLMDSIQFKLSKKLKSSYLEEIHGLIDKENCEDVQNFIKDLTITLLKSCFESKGKKAAKKTVDLSKVSPILVRYINDDLSLQIECVNAIFEFSCNNPNNEKANVCKLFDLFYEHEILSVEAFKLWKESEPRTQKKIKAIEQSTRFFVKLDEHDLSDDFNCTSSTIKD